MSVSLYLSTLANLRLVGYSGFIRKRHKFRNIIVNHCKFYCSGATVDIKNQDTQQKFIPFQEEIKLRRVQARKSIIVQVQSAQSFRELYSYCSSIGTVVNMLHYTVGVEPMHFILLEFDNEESVKATSSAGAYTDEGPIVPVFTQFMWFRTSNKLNKLKVAKNAHLDVQDGTKIMADSDIRGTLENCEDLSEQMDVLYKSTRLNDIGSRLRYLTARQIDMCLSGMFPECVTFPFGSSVNGFGKIGCDLDLVLRLNGIKDIDETRLIFHSKSTGSNDRTVSQRHMEVVGDLVHLFLPGCSRVRKILQARIPIIKYYQQLTHVECDLSMSNMSGVHMSDFLYLMGALDPRVRPLVFTIRKWATEVGLTNFSPGRWISNFSLTLLVLSFLQQPLHSPAILPSLNTLVKLAGPQDKHVTEDGINCTFLRDASKLHHITKNDESLGNLLYEFFEYYSQFDFNSKAVCLNECITLTKPEHSPMYIVNPLERGLNVSKNVSLEELERFKFEARNAAWLLQAEENKSTNWGLLSIFDNKRKAKVSLNFNSKGDRLMKVSSLFEEGSDENDGKIQYKNEIVKKQVKDIRKFTEENVRKSNYIKNSDSNR